MTFKKSEIKYIAYAGIFAFIWFVYLLPYITKLVDGNSPYLQFLIFNLGLYVFLFIFLKSQTTNTSINLTNAFGLMCLFLALDIIMPEYHVTMSGQLVTGAGLGVSTSDYAVGLFATNLGLKGFMVYLFTYLIAPLTLMLISAKIIPDFVKRI